ncbi:MAG: glycosyltransferase [Rhodospirillaceae bacterium]|nr:glycosyltransferase [Rhodospirillaceae bacterium]
MRPNRHLVIFAKAPVLGQVKRRLAGGIGAVAALRFYRSTLTGLIRRVGRDRRWNCWLAVTPDRLARPGQSWSHGLPVLPQGTGDLGARMARVPRRLPPGPAVIIGSDIPAIESAHVARAFVLLNRHDAVFGPAADGGYWLVGLHNRRLPFRLFSKVRWSTADALADTLAGLPSRWRIACCDNLHDIDDADGLAAWRNRSPAMKKASPAGVRPL